jgi:hypothetical protein
MIHWAERSHAVIASLRLGSLFVSCPSAQYAGSKTCQGCRPGKFATQTKSGHARALAPGSPGQWAFEAPAGGTLGNAGSSNVPGPGFYGVDMAVSRVLRVRESMSMEARGEAFNLTNSVRPVLLCAAHREAFTQDIGR